MQARPRAQRSRSRGRTSLSPAAPRTSKFPPRCHLGPPDRVILFIADNSSLKARSPGLCFRASKSLKDKIVPYKYFHWDENGYGEHIRGIDEGDGWVRTERGFLPKELLGKCILKPLVQEAPPTPATSPKFNFEKMFELMIRLCGGPGLMAQKLVEFVEAEFGLENLTEVDIQDMRTSAGAADASTGAAEVPLLSEDAVEFAIRTVHELSHLICICLMDRLGRDEEFVTVVNRIILCVVQVCLQLPPSICGRCSRRMIDLLLHKSVVLEASFQLWKLLTEADRMQPEWVYSSGVLAKEILESLELLLSENSGEEEEVKYQLKSMVTGMRTLIHSVRFHLAWVEKAGMLADGGLPCYAKLAMQSAVQETLPEVPGQSALSGFTADTPGVSEIVQGSFRRHVESWIQEGATSKKPRGEDRDSEASGSGKEKGKGKSYDEPKGNSAAKRKAMTQKFRKWRDDADSKFASKHLEDEEFESQESEEIDSKSSEVDDDDMGLDLADFIDCDEDKNCHGFIDLDDLPRPSSKAVPPKSSSIGGLRAFIEAVRETGGVDAAKHKKMEAFLQLDPLPDWHDQVRNIFKTRSNSLSSDPVPRREPPGQQVALTNPHSTL